MYGLRNLEGVSNCFMSSTQGLEQKAVRKGQEIASVVEQNITTPDIS